MQRKFITNLFFLLLLNLLVKPFWILGIDRSVQNAVGAQSYGDYFALLNFSILLNIILDVGITNFNNRNISQNRQLLTKHFSRLFSMKLLLGGVYLILTLGAGLFIGYSSYQLTLLSILILNQFLVSIILYFRSNLGALHLFKTDSVISVLDRLLMIIICSVLLWGNLTGGTFRIEWFIYAQTVAYGLTAIASGVLVMRRTSWFGLKMDLPFSLMIFKEALPFALLTLLMFFYHRIDGVMLERMLTNGAEQAGVYAQGYRLLEAVNMIGYLFATLLLPIFSRMLAKKEDIRDLANLSYRMILPGAVIIGFSCLFFGEEIMNLLYKEEYATSPQVFGLLMLSFTGVATTYIFGTLLTANGNLRILNYMALGGVFLNVLLNWLLIPNYEALGSAIATIITQLFTALFQFFIAFKVFQFRVKKSQTVQFLVFVGGFLIAGFLLKEWGQPWPISFTIMVVVGCALAFFTKTINVKGILSLIKMEREKD